MQDEKGKKLQSLVNEYPYKKKLSSKDVNFLAESLILAQDERWRCA